MNKNDGLKKLGHLPKDTQLEGAELSNIWHVVASWSQVTCLFRYNLTQLPGV